MSANRSLLRAGPSGLVWQHAGAAPLAVDNDATREALRTELARSEHHVVFAAPGGDVRLTELAVAPEERRHLDASLPFMLEETLAEDIEDLHFARELLGKERCAVGIVAHAWMASWEDLLGEFATDVPWVPEPLLLPWTVGEWTVVFDGDAVLLRSGEVAGTRIERDLFASLLEALMATSRPARIVVYGDDEHTERSLFPSDVSELVTWRRGDLGAALLLAADDPLLDLRQGSYAPQLPYAQVWQEWRAVALLFVGALVLHLVSGWFDLNRLERENLALRGEIQAIYREVNPRGNLVDAERQLRGQIAALRGGADGGSFMASLAPLGERVNAGSGLQLASLTYSQGRGEIRINLLAPDFSAVESLQQALAADGVDAVLENSSRSGDQVRARLRLGGAL